MIYVTSDLHFGHDREFLYGPRGFSNIKEHDDEVLRRWNNIVKPDDTVYVLGDLMLNDDANGLYHIGLLHGHLKIILGNHDTNKRINLYKGSWLRDCTDIEVLGYADVIVYNKIRFYLSHYPTLTGNNDDIGMRHTTFNLCGHTHTQDKFADWDKGPIYHCELDAHNCYPVSIEQIIKDIKERKFNYEV